jgi:hypothetical protein
MLRSVTFIGAAAAALLATGTASGQAAAPGFGEQGQFIVSADRLMPLFAYESEKHANGDGTTDTTTVTSLTFVTHGPALITVYNVPRFALDYVVWKHLTVGGSAWAYFQLGDSRTTSAPGQADVTVDQPKITYWGLAPRVGWILRLGDLFAFWPRGGISFTDNESKQTRHMGNVTVDETNTLTQWAIDLEPMFAFTPVPHAAITAGPVVDIPFAGSVSNSAGGTTVSNDETMFHFGLTAGLLIWF